LVLFLPSHALIKNTVWEVWNLGDCAVGKDLIVRVVWCHLGPATVAEVCSLPLARDWIGGVVRYVIASFSIFLLNDLGASRTALCIGAESPLLHAGLFVTNVL
jgi:hypothetical protein